MAAAPTFDSTPPATITLTLGDTYETLLPPATDPDGDGAIDYTLEPKDTDDPTLTSIGFDFVPGTRLLTATAALASDSLTGASGTYVYTAEDSSSPAEMVTHEIAITVNSTVSFAGTVSNMKYKVGQY
jgi:hypothetical protein